MKKRRISALLAAALTVSLCVAPVQAASASGDERGVIHYEQIIAPQYEDAGTLYEGLAPVKLGGKWGYIDEYNNVVIDFIYDLAYPFSEGLAVVGNSRVAVYDQYDYETGTTSSGELELTVLGRIDKSGSYTPFRNEQYYREKDEYELGDMTVYSDLFDFTRTPYYYNGWVSVNGRVFDVNGQMFKTVDDERYQALSVPAEGLVRAFDFYEDCIVYLDLKGSVVIRLPSLTYYDADWRQITDPDSDDRVIRYAKGIDTYGISTSFNQGMAFVTEYTYDFVTGDYDNPMGFIDRKGNWVIKPQFDYYWVTGLAGECRFFNGADLATLGRDGKHGAIDKTGKTVIPFIYDDLHIFREGLAAFKQGDLYGYLDTDGNIVIPAKYEATSGFSGGIAVAYDGREAFLIDRRGARIPGADAIDPDNYFGTHSDGNVWVQMPGGKYVTIKENGKFGFGAITYTPSLPERSEMDSWAYDEVIEAIKAGLVPVDLQNIYRYNISRVDYSELVVEAVCAILDKEAEDLVSEVSGKSLYAWMRGNPFSDSANDYVIIAYALGLVTGYDDGTFKPYNQISRQEAAVLLWRAAGLLGMDNEASAASGFRDRDNLPDWAVKQVDYVSSIGVMTGVGDNTFSPTGLYTRQQSYITVWRLLRALNAE